MSRPLRFHWSMSAAGEVYKGAKARAEYGGVPDLDAHIAFCRHADACGIDSLLTAIGFHRADPLVLAATLGLETETISFMVACRSGLCSPTSFVQQLNTLSALIDGRVCINVVAGHTPEEQRFYGDYLDHDARYRRTDEFLTVCRALWENDEPVSFEGEYFRIDNAHVGTPFVSPRRQRPEIYLGGKSELALQLAARHADCLWTLPEAPAVMAPRIAPLLATGTEVGLLVSLLCRPSRGEALAETAAMLERFDGRPRRVHRDFARHSDSEAFTSTLALAERSDAWLTEVLWTGAVPYLGAPAIALVGDYDEVADTLLAYREIGITQFLFMGWPDLEEMSRFHHEVEPRVRRLEEAQHSALAPAAAG